MAQGLIREMRLYRQSEVQAVTGLSRTTIWRGIKSGNLRAFGKGKKLRIDESDLRAWIEAGCPTEEKRSDDLAMGDAGKLSMNSDGAAEAEACLEA